MKILKKISTLIGTALSLAFAFAVVPAQAQFTEVAKIQASDKQAEDYFGFSVASSGDRAIVGAYREDTGGSEAGAAYIFERSGGVWSEAAKIQASDKQTNDLFGYSVAISGDRAIVGAVYEDTGGSEAGAAYIFERSSGVWSEVAKIQASDKQTGDVFGKSVAISGDRAIVGASGEDTGGASAGAAYIFERSGGVWSEVAKIQASDKEAFDGFGGSVAISGDRAIVGALGKDTYAGAAYIFERSGGVWSEVAKIQASDKQAVYFFGYSVAISGDRAIVGVFSEAPGYDAAGAAYIFERSGGVWSQVAKIQASDIQTNDFFGTSVTISGDRAIVGAYGKDTGAGAAYIFERSGGVWSEVAKIQASDKQTNDIFGTSVAISGDRAIVGAYGEATGGELAGAAYIFETASNQPPSADAGEDQQICTTTGSANVSLDGSGSSDPDNNVLTYSWKEGGNEIATGENPTVSLSVGTHTIALTVDDGNGGTDTDEVTITVNPLPIVNAGTDKSILYAQTVTLGGNPTAAGGTPPFTYKWSPATALDDPTAANPKVRPSETTTYTVEVTDANGCKATDEVTITVHQFALFANYISVERSKQIPSKGDLFANVNIDIKRGDPTIFEGNLTAVGNICIGKENTINGNVTAGGTITVDRSSKINGTKTPGASVAPIPLPVLSYPAGGPNYTTDDDCGLTLAPGSYGTITMKSGTKLKLSSGDYYLNELLYKGEESVIEIDVTNGPVTINVVSKLQLGKDIIIWVLPDGEAASTKVTFNTMQTGKLEIGKEAYVIGSIVAPKATVVLLNNSQLRGSICADRFEIRRDVLFLHHFSPGTLPGPGRLPKPNDGENTDDAIAEVVTNYELAQNYPNPFNPSTTIRFALPEAGRVQLRIYNDVGQLVRTLAHQELAQGWHELYWEGRNHLGQTVATGVYFYRIIMQDRSGATIFSETRRMSFVK